MRTKKNVATLLTRRTTFVWFIPLSWLLAPYQHGFGSGSIAPPNFTAEGKPLASYPIFSALLELMPKLALVLSVGTD